MARISASKGSSIIEPTLSGRWKLESYGGATAPVVGRPHRSAVALDDLFHDGEPEARAGFGARLRGAVKAIKDVRLITRGDAGSVVTDLEATTGDGNDDRCGAVLQCVVDEVGDGTLDHRLTNHHRTVALGLDCDGAA